MLQVFWEPETTQYKEIIETVLSNLMFYLEPDD